MASRDLDDLAIALRLFAEERDWAQFHTPKNLAMALAGEVGEVLAELQWGSDSEIASSLEGGLHARLAEEMADVLIYLIRLAEICKVDLLSAAFDKVERNKDR